jgi:uncharacterized membrane protein YphA (DoxX/SURF4 family)
VTETTQFFSLSAASTLLVATCLVGTRSESVSRTCAQAFYWLSVTLSCVAFVWITLDAVRFLPIEPGWNWLFRILVYRGWLVIGTAVSCVALLFLNTYATPRLATVTDASRTFLRSPYVLKGICISISVSFLGTEIGKLAHDSDMRQFFLQSGYPVWFLYFIIIAESAAAVGLLIPRFKVFAALGLSTIMVGAIGTHLHNGDPFSDSLEALHLLILLVCILLILRFLGTSRREAKVVSY